MPANFSRSFRVVTTVLATTLAITAITPSNFPRFINDARAQAPQGQPEEQPDFDQALEGYGHWVQHPRLGDVWVPDNVPQDWQPYRIGRWLYTDEWGWYWDSNEDFGWITYHYGRWFFDREVGWVWIPGNEWGPAWVNWRQGDDYVGWAPSPPDEYADEDDGEAYADNYMFVRAGDMMAPDIYTVFIPYGERRDYYRRSSLVNRTIYFADRRGAVNPGIPPAFIASASGRPFHSVSIAPVVLAGTVGVAGAVILQNGFRDRSRTRVSYQESQRSFQPGQGFQRLPGLNKGERGRMDSSLRGAQGGNPVLNLNTQGGSQSKQFRTKSNVQNFEQKKIEEKKVETKQFDQKNFQQKNIQQQNKQQQNNQQKNFQQKQNFDNKQRYDDNRRNFERKDTQQKNNQQQNFQQRNFQQNNSNNNKQQFEKKTGSGNPQFNQQNNQQRNLQQNNNNNKQQNFQQHNNPQPRQQSNPQPKPQQNRSNDKDKKNN